jgi:adenine-specific DNA-methyltransferase
VVEEDEGGLIPVFFPNLLNTREKVLDVLFLRRVLPEIEKVHLHNPHLTHVIFYYVDLENEREITDFLKKKNLSIGIRFEDAKPLLKEHIKQDTIDFSVEQIGEEYRIVIVHFESVVLKNRIDVYNQKMNNPKRKRAKNKQTNPPRLIQLSEHGLELVEFLSLDCTDDSGAWNSDVEIRVDKEGYTHKDGLPQKNLWDGCITAHKRPKRLKIRNISGDECIQKIHL